MNQLINLLINYRGKKKVPRVNVTIIFHYPRNENWRLKIWQLVARRAKTLPPILKLPRPPAALTTVLEQSRCENVTICAIRQPCLLLSTARPTKHVAVPMARRRDVPWIVPHFCNFILHFRSFIFPVRTSLFEKLARKNARASSSFIFQVEKLFWKGGGHMVAL